MTPELSVLLPYRNNADTLAEAVRSVLAQREVPLELLAVDDGSTDAGPALVAELAREDPRVVPLATGGVGIVGALEFARARARGPLLARMDGDDVCRPMRFAQQRAALLRPDAPARLGLVATRVRAFPEELVGEGLARYVAWQNNLSSAEDHARELFVEAPVCHPSVLLPARVLDAVGGFRDVPWAEDYDLWLRLDAQGYALEKLPAVLLDWRQRAGRLTFSHPRYELARFFDAKGPFLAARLRALGRPVAVWGAGPTGKRLARALEPHGVRAALFVDVDPRKIGSTARGAPIVGPDALPPPGSHTVVCAVGARGARELLRAALTPLGYVEGRDYLFAA